MTDKNQDTTYSGDRIQTSFLAKIERKALLWIAPRLPDWVSPDMLTYLGLAAMALVGLSYYLTRHHWMFLNLASLGLVLNWFGDSLDGTLARVRKQERPRYGYYIDHLVDAFGISFVIFGLAYSGLVHQPFVWMVLALFLITSINTYLATNATNIFKISYLRISTTEARLLLIVMNVVLIYLRKVTIFGFTFYLLDFFGVAMSLFLLVAILRSAIKNLRQLDREERAKWADNQAQPDAAMAAGKDMD